MVGSSQSVSCVCVLPYRGLHFRHERARGSLFTGCRRRLVFPRRDLAARARPETAARTGGCTLAGGGTRIRGAPAVLSDAE